MRRTVEHHRTCDCCGREFLAVGMTCTHCGFVNRPALPKSAAAARRWAQHPYQRIEAATMSNPETTP